MYVNSFSIIVLPTTYFVLHNDIFYNNLLLILFASCRISIKIFSRHKINN